MPEEIEPAPQGTFEAVPTLEGFLWLVRRIEKLEAPKLPEDGEDGSLSARLDRHREELEEIKRRWNDLMKFLDLTLSNTATTPAQQSAAIDLESYQ